MTTPDERPRALRSAKAAATAWAETVEHQREATPRTHFYALAGEVVATLHALDDLSVVLAHQVAGYGDGRTLYDDTRTTDPADRLAEAVGRLHGLRSGLVSTTAAADAFWSAIGHVGVEVAP